MESGIYHMVISDLRMETEEAGMEVIRAARRQSYAPATALLTAYPPSEEYGKKARTRSEERPDLNADQATRDRRFGPPARSHTHPPRRPAATSGALAEQVRPRPASCAGGTAVTRRRCAALAENTRDTTPAVLAWDGTEPSYPCRIANRRSAFPSWRKYAAAMRFRVLPLVWFCSSYNVSVRF